jgi:hypothetical protein
MTTEIDTLLAAAVETARASEVAHKNVWASPKNGALVDVLQAAMIAEREARLAYEAAAGKALDLHGAYDAMGRKTERAMDRAMDRDI